MRFLPQRRRRDDHCHDHRRLELIVQASRSPKKEPTGSFFCCRGFSFIELVVVILIVGIISVFVGARISDTQARTRGFYDELASQVRFARKVAVAQRRTVCVHIGAAQSRLFYSNALGNACPAATGVSAPTGEVPFTVAIPAGVAVTVVVFQFDALGRPRTAAGVLTTAPLVVTVAGDGDYPITVQNESGYVL